MTVLELAPPLLGINHLRVDSAVSSRSERYEEDKKWFTQHPKRRMYLRADIDEFDPSTIPISEKLQMPMLHVLVTAVAPSVHTVQPVFRGKQFWNYRLDDDAAVAFVLVQMQEMKGIDAREFSEFLDRIAARNREYRALAASTNSGKQIH